MTILNAGEASSRSGGPSFSRANRIYRAVWQLTWLVAARWTPAPLHAWRRFILRRFGAKVGSSATVYGDVTIWSPANIEIGDTASLGHGVRLYSMARIKIGAFAVISQGAHLCAGTHNIDDPLFQIEARPITVGRNAWVAADAFVGPGVTLGEGAVLGARGCAFRDLKPWTVYVGNPAGELKSRRPSAIGEHIERDPTIVSTAVGRPVTAMPDSEE